MREHKPIGLGIYIAFIIFVVIISIMAVIAVDKKGEIERVNESLIMQIPVGTIFTEVDAERYEMLLTKRDKNGIEYSIRFSKTQCFIRVDNERRVVKVERYLTGRK